MLDVVLYQPEIPPNTGNVIRLCANAGAKLHLVQPLGFSLDDRNLRRAGMDYRELTDVSLHADWAACRAALAGRRMFAFTTRASRLHAAQDFAAQDVLVFGPETRGLPQEVLADFAPTQCLRLPMRPDNRSINLSNAVAVAVYEAWRQLDYIGGS
jgi:tRNA (cytidine/uridine-2'-O-)-methyltransferase